MQPMMPEERAAPAAPPGSPYLIDIVLHRIDPSQPDPGLPEPPEVTGEEERDFAIIRREMAQKLRSHLRDYTTLNPNGIFVLNDRQDRTLEGLGLPRSTREAVRSLNCLMYQVKWYHTNERLEVIQSMPATPEGGMPDWQQWWLDNTESRTGARAHLSRETEPAEKTLDLVVAAIARDAVPHLPPGNGHCPKHRPEEREQRKRQEEAGGPQALPGLDNHPEADGPSRWNRAGRGGNREPLAPGVRGPPVGTSLGDTPIPAGHGHSGKH